MTKTRKVGLSATPRRPGRSSGVSGGPRSGAVAAPSGYHKAIGRMRLANQKKQKKKEMMNYMPRGENYEKRKNERVFVPRCATLKSKNKPKRKPFMYLDVNIAPGK